MPLPYEPHGRDAKVLADSAGLSGVWLTLMASYGFPLSVGLLNEKKDDCLGFAFVSRSARTEQTGAPDLKSSVQDVGMVRTRNVFQVK